MGEVLNNVLKRRQDIGGFYVQVGHICEKIKDNEFVQSAPSLLAGGFM